MHLKFLGTGGRLNAAHGNTSAYYTEDDKLLLIDCGETAFGEIQELHLLDGISKVFFICTHAHLDNVGGLGNLCLYCHQKNIEFYVVTDPSYILIYDLYDLLQISSCKGLWNSIDTSKLEKHFSEIQVVQYIRTEHYKDSYGANIPAYLVHFYTKDGPILYSGNTNRID